MSKKKRTLSGQNCKELASNEAKSLASVDSSYMSSFENLKHCVFFWTIEHCSFYPRNDVLKSPLFSSDFSSSVRWGLELNLNLMDEENPIASLDLVRHDFDETCSDRLHVDCRLGVLTTESEILYKCTIHNIFEPGYRKSGELIDGIVEQLYSKGVDKHDAVIITCNMFIQCCETSSRKVCSAVNVDRHLLRLSRDFSSFFELKELCNFRIHVDDGEVVAHKEICASRSRYFADFLRKGEDDFLICFGLKTELAKRLLLYAYSGVFDFSGFERSGIFALRKFADKFQLQPLREYLEPTETMACTEMKVQSCQFKWLIRDFEFHDHHCHGYLKSPVFNCGDPLSRETWYLRLNFKNSKDQPYIGLELGVSGLRRKILLSAEILSVNSLSGGEVNQVLEMENDCVISFPRFLKRKITDDSSFRVVSDNDLCVLCNLQISDMTESRKTTSDVVIRSRLVDFKVHSLRQLSEDFYRLQNSGEFSDIHFKCGDRKFPLHASILRARWPYFRERFEDFVERSKYHFTDIKSYAMKKVIIYLYSGQMDSMYPYGAIDIYMLAEKFNILHVKSICSFYLRSHLNVNIVSSVLVLADKSRDLKLKSVAIDYIHSHYNEVLSTIEWINLAKQWPDISREVIAEVSRRGKM